ncbi:hypothetical protein N658DRAFT_515965 [Parathielavia hyrcaniae]|uniref:Uncharacterized protein n=1 Tax=Parathielavia hyrcaniae TaxID=113614 RepID=A0AAN6T238_9PEZI|nr:hypothetical protein N658DRAFT_515965 [Parathielavia hyrcaniae]
MGIPHSLLWLIGIATFLLSVDAAVSLALVSTMVAFLHDHGHGPFAVTPRGKSPFLLFDEPASLVTDQGHTGNAAGGTALVLVGFGGVISLWRESRTRKKWTRSSHLFYIWSVVVLLSWFLTTAALIYTLVETSMTSGQAIDVGVAWTPENWYAAVLALPLASADQRRVVGGNLRLMRAWRWNLVALLLLGSALLALVAVEVAQVRRRNRQPVSMAEVLVEPSSNGSRHAAKMVKPWNSKSDAMRA